MSLEDITNSLIDNLKQRDRLIEEKVKTDPQYLIDRGYCPLKIADYRMQYFRRDNLK